jgi:hypothetical protein
MAWKPYGPQMLNTVSSSQDMTIHGAAIVEPSVFVARLVSREALERVRLVDSDLLGLRNLETGETLYVNELGLQRWMQGRD